MPIQRFLHGLYSAQLDRSSYRRRRRFHSRRRHRLHLLLSHRPCFAQLAGHDPDVVLRAGRIVQEKVDAVDINFGCPQESEADTPIPVSPASFGSLTLDLTPSL